MDATLLQPGKSLSAQSSVIIHKGIGAYNSKSHMAARKAATDFEAVFLTTMLEQAFTGVDAPPPFGGGHSERVYRSLLVGEYANDLAKSGGIGVADHVYREILAAQEGLS